MAPSPRDLLTRVIYAAAAAATGPLNPASDTDDVSGLRWTGTRWEMRNAAGVWNPIGANVGLGAAGGALMIPDQLTETTLYPNAPAVMMPVLPVGADTENVIIRYAAAWAGFSAVVTSQTVLQLCNRADPAAEGAQTITLPLGNGSGESRFFIEQTGTLTFTAESGKNRLYARCTTAGGHGKIQIFLSSL